jgi:hypothetical protein
MIVMEHCRNDLTGDSNVTQVNNLVRAELEWLGGIRNERKHNALLDAGVCQVDNLRGSQGEVEIRRERFLGRNGLDGRIGNVG